jgi:hypothetical protein
MIALVVALSVVTVLVIALNSCMFLSGPCDTRLRQMWRRVTGRDSSSSALPGSSAVLAQPYTHRVSTIPIVPQQSLYGHASASSTALVGLSSTVGMASAAEDQEEGMSSMQAGLGVIADGPTGARAHAPKNGILGHSQNLIPMSARDSVVYGNRTSHGRAVMPGQATTGTLYPQYDVGDGYSRDLVSASEIIRNGSDRSLRPSRETCRQVCTNTFPGMIPPNYAAQCNCSQL